MKKEVKRYTLVEYIDSDSKKLFGKSATEAIDNINKHNSKKSEKEFIKFIYYNHKSKIIFFKRYRKISEPNNLRELDRITTHETFANNTLIAYRSNKRIKTLPILTKDDKKYINMQYTSNKLFEYARDYKLISMIINNPSIKANSIKCEKEYNELYTLLHDLETMDKSLVSITPLANFFYEFTLKDGYIDYFKFRMFILILKEYESSLRKIPKSTNTKIEEYEQLMIDNYQIGSLKSVYEEMKMGDTRNSKKLKIKL